MDILFLSKDILFPLDSGGKIRTSNILRYLNKEFNVDIISLLDPEEEKYIPKMQRLCRKLIYIRNRKFKKNGFQFYSRIIKNLFSPYPFTMMNDYNPALYEKIHKIANRYDLLVCDFLFPALNCLDVKIPKVLFQHNVEFMISKRNFEKTLWPKKIIWFLQYIKTKRMEKIITQKFDYVICVSENDKSIHEKEFGVRNVDYVDLGVNLKQFNNNNSKRERKSLVFTGGMDWTPNDDAVKYFHDNIFPKLEGFKFYCVGKKPSDSLRKLNNKYFIITGRVIDIKPFLFEKEIYVVPLRSGSGTRIKIFEAMAAKIPVVSTTIGAEGLPVKHGKNILIGDTPKEFANAIIKLDSDPELYNKITNNAYKLVKESYSWGEISRKFINICRKVGSKRKKY